MSWSFLVLLTVSLSVAVSGFGTWSAQISQIPLTAKGKKEAPSQDYPAQPKKDICSRWYEELKKENLDK